MIIEDLTNNLVNGLNSLESVWKGKFYLDTINIKDNTNEYFFFIYADINSNNKNYFMMWGHNDFTVINKYLYEFSKLYDYKLDFRLTPWCIPCFTNIKKEVIVLQQQSLFNDKDFKVYGGKL